MTALAVGSIVLASYTAGSASPGTTKAGSALACCQFYNATPAFVTSGDSLSGTWQSLQTLTEGSGSLSGNYIGLWQRIA